MARAPTTRPLPSRRRAQSGARAAAAASIKWPKAGDAAECRYLEQLPNVGPAMAADLRRLGIERPAQLRGGDAHGLYLALCRATGKRHDPCVLDTFIAIVDFMGGAAPRPWWAYTALRKQKFPQV
jgi:hypothetical protein